MFEQIAANKRKSVVLIVIMAVVLLALGFVLGEVFFGEGAGYAGGILSAATDGLRTAEVVIARYAPTR